MKKIIVLSFLLLLAGTVWADLQKDIPQNLKQADGSRLSCFVSGDEFYHRLHDAAGYTLLLADDGYYYYAKKNNKGQLVPSVYRADQPLPADSGLEPNLGISAEAYQSKRKQRMGDQEPAYLNVKSVNKINGIAIYIQFADDPNYSAENIVKHHQTFLAEDGPSLRHYYRTVSYGQLDLTVLQIPANENPAETPLAYVDSKARNYYRPYNATLNPIGYSGDSERSSREKTLLKNALLWVKKGNYIPSDYDLDIDGDGYCDLLAFVIRGDSDGWSDLLWAHKWQLEMQYQVELQPGVKSYVYTFQNENQCVVRTLCHETFHAFGAPDLYHYDDLYSRLQPMGNWDIMELSEGHMSTHMKSFYTSWMATNYPTIKSNGRYVLYPQAKHNNRSMLRIDGATGDDYYLLEYRNRNTDMYERKLLGDGLLISRVYSPQRGRGNAEYNGTTVFDELYALRPNGTPSTNGMIHLANHSKQVGRPAIGVGEPTTFYNVKGVERKIRVYDIDDRGDSIVFSVFLGDDFQASRLETTLFRDTLGIHWTSHPSSSEVVLLVDTMENSQIAEQGTTFTEGQVLASGAKVLYVGTDSLFLFHEGFDKTKTYYFQLFSRQDSSYSSPRTTQYTYVPPSVEQKVDTLTNIANGQELALYSWKNTWGTVSGHNGFGDKIFLEQHTLTGSGTISGLLMRVGKIKTHHGTDSKIHLKVYASTPLGLGKEIYSQPVNLIGMSTGIRRFDFSEAVRVEGTFYVGYQVEYKNPSDTFCVYTTKHREESTATFYVVDKDDAFSSIASIGNYLSLYVLPIITEGNILMVYPDAFPVTEDLNQSKQLQLSTNYSDYTVATTAHWITVNTDPFRSLIHVTIAYADSLVGQIGEVQVVSGNDTARCIINLSTTSNVQVTTSETLLQIYPNPSRDGLFTVDGLGKAKELRIYDISGRCLEIRRFEGGKQIVDLSKYASGIYFLHTDISPNAYKLIKP